MLNKFKSTLQSSVSSTVFSTVSTIKDVLPGNPVTREYEIGEHIASAGPGMSKHMSNESVLKNLIQIKMPRILYFFETP